MRLSTQKAEKIRGIGVDDGSGQEMAGSAAGPGAVRPVFVYDIAVAAAVRGVVLPAHIEWREADFSAATGNARLAQFDVRAGHGSGRDGSSIVLGFILPPPGQARDDAQFEELRNLLPEDLRGDAIFFTSPRCEVALADWCWRRLCGLSGHLLRAYARGQIALAGYREREAQLERSLAAAEAAFVDFRKEPLKLALRLEPSGVYVRPKEADGRAIAVKQTLRVLLANVLYIDVFFSRDGAALAGEARFLARAGYSGTVICDTKFAFSEICQGWKRFFCGTETPAGREPLEIELTLSSDEVIDVLPGLSNPSPIEQECAFQEGSGSVGRPLALQVWCGIAGLRYPRHFNAAPPVKGKDAPALEILSVNSDTLAAASAFFVPRRDLDFTPVSYEGETQSLLVHPLGRAPTVAKLSGLTVAGLKSISALAQLRRFDAKATDFAILAFPSADRPPRFDDKAGLEDRVTRQLKWLHLKGGEWGELHVDLPETLSGDVDVYLVTRNETDDYDLSWAFFRGIYLECLA
jgi:hypothetical protein